jgi:preprotein translocase subunit SecG
MGTPTVLGKATGVVAALFMITSFGLSMMSHHRAQSIMPASGPAAPATPAAPSAPAATPAPAPPAPQK